MKRFQKTLALLLVLLTLLAAMSVPAVAAGYKVETLKTGTWYKTQDEIKTIYKLKLTADSIVTVNWKGNSSEEAYIYFYDSKKCDHSVYEDDLYSTSGSRVIVLSKGTYYIAMYDYNDKPAKFKITFKKAINKPNYCRAKAITLKPSETVDIAQTASCYYYRWYKITVPKKKMVTITTPDASFIDLYDSKMNRVKCFSNEKKIVTQDKIVKGTYFIRVSPFSDYDDDMSEYLGNCITFKWN